MYKTKYVYVFFYTRFWARMNHNFYAPVLLITERV